MCAIVASDNRATATQLQHVLVQLGYECLIGDVLAVDDVAQRLEARGRPPDLALVVLPDDDRGLRQLKLLGESTAARIIAVGPGNDPERILAAIHAGADDYLVETQEFFQQLSSFVSRSTVKRETEATSGRLTIVASVGGGSGASVIASNLAVLVAKERGACGLLDFDSRSGDQATLFNLKPRYTLAELCRNIDDVDQNMLKQSLTVHESGVRLIAGLQRPADIGCLSADGLRKVMRIARSVMGDVIADVGSVSDGGNVDQLRTASRILLVFRSDFPCVRRANVVLDAWDDAGIDRHVVRLVANSCGQSKQLPIARIQSALGKQVLSCLPDDREAMNLSINCGNPIVQDAPKSAFSKSMLELGASVGLLADGGQPAREGIRLAARSLFSRLSTLTRGVVQPLTASVAR